MLYQIFYTQKAVDDLSALPKTVARRVDKKLEYFSKQNRPLDFAEPLTNFEFGQYRFRVGDYRIVFDINKKDQVHILMILRVKHRKEVYR